ncbi:2-methylisocitrate lyase-like PEP mutase family enzyme [Rhodoligotrophos appendicifer]|uniref:hypothetical protein n=1 Tax=Rhodoligotrophos appendicifer TaxID=987056 RepID=UPI0011852257|nr:hypothetical protein [Rhodoligotrophos appendicifer]
MVDKIKIAVDTRDSDDFMSSPARMARTALGLNETFDRSHAYAESGTDLLFIESPETEEELAKISRSFSVPMLANMVDGGRTPFLSADR